MKHMKKKSVTVGMSIAAACGMGLVVACGSAQMDGEENAVDAVEQAATSSVIKHVFVIAMENHDSTQIYGNTGSAPYINNTLLPNYAHSTNFNDELALSIPSEPHYVWMEAGTNAFSDHTFTGDGDPTSSNSTSDTNHLATQIKNATNGVTWRTYQEGLNSSTGACPIHSNGFYAAKHDPFVFFKDVAGNPPSASNSYCSSHHRAYSAFAGDLGNGDVASYTFITPNLCNDMHGASGCPNSNTIKSGDTWLSTELPRIISYANANAGVIFVTWDEGSSTLKTPFLAIGPGVKTNYTGTVSYNHSSVIKSIDKILGLSTLSRVSSANDLAGLFKAGQYP
jgi:phospholipase C